jgi:hypothetical protein
LTREQVRHSPVVDSAEPVSRQQEIAMASISAGPLVGWIDRPGRLPSRRAQSTRRTQKEIRIFAVSGT